MANPECLSIVCIIAVFERPLLLPSFFFCIVDRCICPSIEFSRIVQTEIQGQFLTQIVRNKHTQFILSQAPG